MKEKLRHDILRWQQGPSQRHIASALGLTRRTAVRVLAAVSPTK